MTQLFDPCSTSFFDMSKFKVLELGREFQLYYVDSDDGHGRYSPRVGKTVVKYLDDSDEDQSKFVLLTLNKLCHKKCLIESSGEMLLVDMYLRMGLDAANQITRKITVFKLVEREKIWVEVKDLGDKILFLGEQN
ncbi:PREDICTED: F-box protein SKIP23-like [Camelina sativa]|uniref:F-box protein SKIP23-like n=1 Tax=Camelina sativa TaxID=90675 RepID=A0ABM1RLC2_CAMSA|nr:PREDICTED: F-box protein SKIP23-like [Camelina sativa]